MKKVSTAVSQTQIRFTYHFIIIRFWINGCLLYIFNDR